MRNLIGRPILMTVTTAALGAATAALSAPQATAAAAQPLPPVARAGTTTQVATGARVGTTTRAGSAPRTAAVARTVFTLIRSKTGASSRAGKAKTMLTCEPTGGTHPKAVQACTDLQRSNGAFEHADPEAICPMVYSPVTVEAVGRYRGAVKRFKATYGNDCVMRSRTGSIFGF